MAVSLSRADVLILDTLCRLAIPPQAPRGIGGGWKHGMAMALVLSPCMKCVCACVRACVRVCVCVCVCARARVVAGALLFSFLACVLM